MTWKRQNQHPLPSSSILFFKFILRTSLEHGELKIPNKFTRKYGGGLPNPVLLKPPDGSKWKVHWTEDDDGIWFEKGWKEFAKHYSLDHGHMVLFDYQESSHFEVHIFEKSALEIEYPFHGSQDEESNLDQIRDNSVETLDEPPPCQKTRQKSTMSCPQPLKKMRTSTSGDVGTSSNLPNMSQHVRMEGNHRSKGTNFQKSTSASPNLELVVLEKMGGSSQCVKVEKEEVASETAEALSNATALKSKTMNPSFRIVLTPSYVNGKFLHIPSQFAEKHLKGKEGNTLLLVLDGKSWPVNYIFRKFSAGWTKFVLGNRLKIGDVCVFVLTKSQGLSLNARIFRVPEEPHSRRPSQDSVVGDGVNGKEIVPKRILIVEGEGGKETQRASMLRSNSRRKFINRAPRKANKFVSENPFFIVNIRPHKERDQRPYVPTAFVRKHFNDKQSVTLQFVKKLWSVKLLNSSYGTVFKLSRGWNLFVKENKLVGGDVCVFELINREDAVLHVHIFRHHS